MYYICHEIECIEKSHASRVSFWKRRASRIDGHGACRLQHVIGFIGFVERFKRVKYVKRRERIGIGISIERRFQSAHVYGCICLCGHEL